MEWLEPPASSVPQRVFWFTGPLAIGGWIPVAVIIAVDPPWSIPIRGLPLVVLAVITSLVVVVLVCRLPYKATSTAQALTITSLARSEVIPRTRIADICGQAYGGYVVIRLVDGSARRILGPCTENGTLRRGDDHLSGGS